MQRHISYFMDITLSVLPSLLVPVALMALCVLVMQLSACSKRSPHASQDGELRIEGSVTYRERMALPNKATLVVTLYKTADGQQRVPLASTQVDAGRSGLPIPFSLAIPELDMTNPSAYELEAQISADDVLLFATPTLVPFVPDSTLSLLVCRVMETEDSTTHSALQPQLFAELSNLTGKRWALRELNGRQAETFDNQPEPHLIFIAPEQSQDMEGRLAGSDGCNRLIGSYTLNKQQLMIHNLGTSMMLCPRGEAQAQAFAKALEKVSAWRLSNDGNYLRLLQGKQILLVFEGVTL